MRIALAALLVAAAIIGAQAGSDIAPGEYRSLDGTGNNKANPTWGAAMTPYVRLNIPDIYYSDNKFSPNNFMPDGRPLPNGRMISNALFAGEHLLTPRNVNDMHTYYGMVITGDLSSVQQSLPQLGGETPLLVFVPYCDPFFDYTCTGTVVLGVLRSMAAPGTGTASGNPRQQVNTDTHYLDLSNVYGNGCPPNVTLCPEWRTGYGGQITKVWYEYWLQYVPAQTQFFMGGDIRINKTPPVTSLVEIYHREHNRMATELAATNSSWTDEQLFQEARKWCIAIHQKLTTREYLAALLGQPLPPYTGYNPNANPTVENVFPANAFRYGHPEINSVIYRTDAAGNEIPQSHLITRDIYFKPLTTTFTDVGIEPVLWGLTFSVQGLIGLGWTNDVRNMPFGAPVPSNGPTNDLLAMNIHRSRDHGLPAYNLMRVAYGLQPFTSWTDFSNETWIQEALASLYTTVDDVDSYLGAVLEVHEPAASIGVLWWNIVREQFTRTRDGDRFWYENPNGQFSADEIATIYNVTLPILIERNTNITGMNLNIFFTTARQLPTADSGAGVLFQDDNMQAHIDLSPTYRLGWSVNDSTNCIDYRLQVFSDGWVGIGWQPDTNTMKNADIAIARYFEDNNTFQIFDCYAQDVGVPTFDTVLPNGQDNLLNKNVYISRGLMIVEFSKPFDSGDQWDKVLSPGAKQIIFAYNPTDKAFVYHGPTRSAAYTIDFWTIPGVLTEESNATGLIIVIAILIGILGLMCVLTFVMVVTHLDHPIIRYATPLFCCTTLAGILVSLAGLATQLASEPTNALCMINFWLMGAGFVLTFGSVFVKSWRIWRVLAAAKKLERQIISQGLLAGIVGVALLLEMGFMAIWQGVDPLKVHQVTISGSDSQYKNACRSDSDGFLVAWVAYKGFTMLIGLFLAFKVKDSFREFNESKGIVASIYIVALVVFFCIPLGFGLRDYPNIELVIEAIGILFSYAGILVALFWDKFRVIVLKDELDDGRSFTFRSTTGSIKSNAGASSAQSTASVSN